MDLKEKNVQGKCFIWGDINVLVQISIGGFKLKIVFWWIILLYKVGGKEVMLWCVCFSIL
jgi:hypothetical protein